MPAEVWPLAVAVECCWVPDQTMALTEVAAFDLEFEMTAVGLLPPPDTSPLSLHCISTQTL